MNATPSDLRFCRWIWNRMLRFNEHWLSKPKGEPQRGRFARCSLIGIALCLANISGFEKAHSAEVHKVNHYRQWAFIQLNNLEFFYCLDELNYKESRWNPKAKNGSHHGIPQGRSLYLARVDGYKQVQWGLDYIGHRYGEPCVALDHWSKYGWH